jgi:hypothetical protein
MAAYGPLYDEEKQVAFVQDGCIYLHDRQGKLIGYEEDGAVTDLQHRFIGQLEVLGVGSEASSIRRLLEPDE